MKTIMTIMPMTTIGMHSDADEDENDKHDVDDAANGEYDDNNDQGWASKKIMAGHMQH